LWWSLALGVDLGGNATAVAGTVNLFVGLGRLGVPMSAYRSAMVSSRCGPLGEEHRSDLVPGCVSVGEGGPVVSSGQLMLPRPEVLVDRVVGVAEPPDVSG